MVVIIGKHSTDTPPDSEIINYNNWQSYEIAKNHEKKKVPVVVKLDSSYSTPDENYNIETK